jgi:hypothetical protein
VPYNESWGVPELTAVGEQRHAVEALYHLTKTLDATRPVIGNFPLAVRALNLEVALTADVQERVIHPKALAAMSSVARWSTPLFNGAGISPGPY